MFFENLHPFLVLMFIYCTDNSTTDEAYKQYSNILYTSYTKNFLPKKLQVYKMVFCTWFFMHFAQGCLKIAIHKLCI